MNNNLFATQRGEMVQATDAVNEAGGVAYTRDAKSMLAQLATTGCFGNTFYVTAEKQLETVLELCKDLEPEYIAKVAIHARERAYMKDMPALLCAILTTRGQEHFRYVFDRVIDSPRMLRTFMQIMRSGVVGRKSLGSMPKKAVQDWINNASYRTLINASVGNNPSLKDIIKMVRPKPANDERRAFYAWIIGREYDKAHLPSLVEQLESFQKSDDCTDAPNLDFRLLTSTPLSPQKWKALGYGMSANALRQNLNTLGRHDVLTDVDFVKHAVDTLQNVDTLTQYKIMPYQLFTSLHFADSTVPDPIKDSLRNALNATVANFPDFEGKKVAVFLDSSGSMTSSPVTGMRGTATSKMVATDVGCLLAAAFVAKSNSTVYLFDDALHLTDPKQVSPLNHVTTNIEKFRSAMTGGGTNCSLPMQYVLNEKLSYDLIIYISDNESWLDKHRAFCNGYKATKVMELWNAYVEKVNPNAKLVCMDLTPNTSTQAIDKHNVMNVGGFNDAVMPAIEQFALMGRSTKNMWIDQIEQISLTASE